MPTVPIVQNVLYQIEMGTGLMLSVNPSASTKAGSQLVLAGDDRSDRNQLWSLAFYPVTQASIIFNPEYRLYAAPQSITKGAPVLLYEFENSTNFTNSTTWQVQQESNAIRTPQDTGLNMNAYGSTWQPGTAIVIWTWGGGQPNETWKSVLAAVPFTH